MTTEATSVADVVGATIAAQGVKDAFGILGSGNLIVTNALARGGARFHHARHEGGAVCMADGYARVSGRVGVCRLVFVMLHKQIHAERPHKLSGVAFAARNVVGQLRAVQQAFEA